MGFIDNFTGSDLNRLWREIDAIQPAPPFMLHRLNERGSTMMKPKCQDEAKVQLSRRQRQSLRGQFRGR